MPQFKIQSGVTAVIYGHTVVEADTLEQAIEKAEADILANGWQSVIWQDWEQASVDFSTASALQIDEGGHSAITTSESEGDNGESLCTSLEGHSWVEEEREDGREGRCYCEFCGADGDG